MMLLPFILKGVSLQVNCDKTNNNTIVKNSGLCKEITTNPNQFEIFSLLGSCIHAGDVERLQYITLTVDRTKKLHVDCCFHLRYCETQKHTLTIIYSLKAHPGLVYLGKTRGHRERFFFPNSNAPNVHQDSLSITHILSSLKIKDILSCGLIIT